VKQHKTILLFTLFALSFVSTLTLARTDARMDESLTPIGAERAGNASGTIPAWDGGIATALPGHKLGGHYEDPYANENPLFTITAANLEQYKENLSPGQIALLKKFPDYRMPVYPTHRSAAYPMEVYDATQQAVSNASLAPGGNGVLGVAAGFPFPLPKNGSEAIWNHLMSYRGETYAMNYVLAAITREGDFTPVRVEVELDYSYGNLSKTDAQREPNRLFNFLQSITSPARLAGGITLAHEPVDQVMETRTAWTYSPGQRRVRLAPEVSYDSPSATVDGLRTMDDTYMFNGAIDRYNWKLAGKKEMYIPYNSYALMNPKLKYTDLIRPGHLNPEYTRYELHRVWVVEATLKPEFRNIYSKRVFYLDEDSWTAMAADKYDARGELWRYAEAYSINMYDVPMLFDLVTMQYDLQSGRYAIGGLRNEEPWIWKPLRRSKGDYTPARLRNMGTR